MEKNKHKYSKVIINAHLHNLRVVGRCLVANFANCLSFLLSAQINKTVKFSNVISY